MRRIRTYAEVGTGSDDVPLQVEAQERRLRERLAVVRRVVVVASGKGGVGKSAIAANLAAALGALGQRVGALDADVGGPCLARMLGARRGPLVVARDGVLPAPAIAGVSVMSSDLLVDADVAVRWGPASTEHLWQSLLETGMLREFLSDVTWGPLDWLIVDLAPGADKLARLAGLRVADFVLLVTTPSAAATSIVARSAGIAREAAPAVGIVANMTHQVCRSCGAPQPLYVDDTIATLAHESGIPVLAGIPFDPRLATRTDAGAPIVLDDEPSAARDALRALAQRLLAVPMRRTVTPDAT